MSIDGLGVIGWVVAGVLPALLWTYVNVRRAARRRERQLVRRGSILVWGLVAVYLALLRVIPENVVVLAFLVYGALFLLAVSLLGWRRYYLREHDFPGSYLFARRAPSGR